jgi:hypothetical protein
VDRSWQAAIAQAMQQHGGRAKPHPSEAAAKPVAAPKPDANTAADAAIDKGSAEPDHPRGVRPER